MRDFRADRLELFASSRPGPRAQPKKDKARTLALALRREGRSLREIERALAAEGVPLSKTAIWELVGEEGLGRLEIEPEPEPLALIAAKARRLREEDWAAGQRISSEHAGLFLLVPELVELDIRTLITQAGYPSTTQLAALNSLLALLALKLYEERRRSHVYDVVHDRALGLFCGLNALPKRTHLTGYSYRTTRAHNQALLQALVQRQRALGLISGESFNLDFHAIMSYGEDQILEEHYVPRRSQRTRAVLTFFAQDGRDGDALLRQRRPVKSTNSRTRSSASASSGRTPPARSPACSCSTRRSPPTPSWPSSTSKESASSPCAAAAAT